MAENAGASMTRKRGEREEGGERERRDLAALALWTELTCLTGAVRQALEWHLGDQLGILPEEATLLVELTAAPEQRLRMADVSRELRMSKSGVTRLVDRLARRGLIARAACPKDRRGVYAGLTEEGRRTAAAAAPMVAAGVAERLAGDLSADELAALAASLRSLREGKGAAPTIRPPSPRS